MHSFRSTVLASLAVSALVATLATSVGCAPRASGLEARREADARFRRTTSLVSFDQAKQAFEAGQLDRARKECEAAIARSDKEAKYWSLLGRIELEAKRLEKSLESFAKAIECDPALAEPYYYRGIVYQRWSDNAKAIEDYRKAAELDPDRVSYLLAAAELLVADRQLDDARMLLLPKLGYFEHNAAMHELLGDIAALSGDHASAARSYERSLVIDGEAPLVSEKLVSALFAAKEWQKCLEAARRERTAAVAGANGRRAEIPAPVYRFEGRSLTMLGRTVDARNVFVEQCRSFPEDVEAWHDLAAAALETGDLDRAEAAADRMVALAQDDAVGYTLRGLVAERKERFDEAVRWHRLAVARAPRDVEAKVALGLALRRQGKGTESARILAEALELDPTNELARRAFIGAAGSID
jgi:tetratricopeptide (TPR) repeat protein